MEIDIVKHYIDFGDSRLVQWIDFRSRLFYGPREYTRVEFEHLVAFSGSPDGAANLVDWLNNKMFAYPTIDDKNIFELGLALQAPEGMYK